MPKPHQEARETGSKELGHAFDQLVDQILKDRDPNQSESYLVGIARGGVPVAKRLASLLSGKPGIQPKTGILDISFQRDDLDTNPIPTKPEGTLLPFDVEGSDIILVDDVLQSGRTVRAALNELFDLGRPRRVRLAILFDRGGRSLPVQPDYVALRQDVPEGTRVRVHLGPDGPSPEDRIEILPPT